MSLEATPNPAPPLIDGEMAEAILNQAFDLWFNPEIERRKQAGTLPDDFVLLGAQVIMNVGEPNQVRLNSEVKVVLAIRLNRDVQAGEMGQADDLERIEAMYLKKDVDPNAGHLTLLRVGDRWCLHFDFLYNATRVDDLVNAAAEFFEAAEQANAKGHRRAFVENLFAASELTAKAQLMMLPDERVLKSRKHGFISSQINFQSRSGNADGTFVQLLNELSQMRGQARYVEGTVDLDPTRMLSMVTTAKTALDRITRSVPRRV